MDRSAICDRFLDAVPFDLYPFQEEAILAWFGGDRSLMLCAPTGMGKTLIAEAAVFEALHTGRRLYYSTPLIALTDQKFRELQDKAQAWGFDPQEVGLITGNRKVNPNARIRVVVAEILLNHLLSGTDPLHDVTGVVMDEFHYFNDFERGIVWELSLVLLPTSVRTMLLSATVGNPAEFLRWLSHEHGKGVQLIQSGERRVPLEFHWVGDRLLTEHLPAMISKDDDACRTPALVFCFNRDECWEIAERLKGLKLIGPEARTAIEAHVQRENLDKGIGPKLRQMLICGVGVHHAGVLPRHKEVVEELFLKKLIPFVVCTETLAAGINLPARSVVITRLLKGKPGEEKLIPSSAAHQMFGRAGRPQFDKKGHVYALAHEDDVKIFKWHQKYDRLDPNSKDPGILRAKKELLRKKPTRRKTERYWSEGQFRTLIEAGPAKLLSRSMIPYQVLIYLLTNRESLTEVRAFLSKRFNSTEKLAAFQTQLDRMIDNLATFGYLRRGEQEDQLILKDHIHTLLTFRSVNPLYGAFLVEELVRSDFNEKVLALESVLPVPPAILRPVRPPEDMPEGPLQTQVIRPLLIQMGILSAEDPDRGDDDNSPAAERGRFEKDHYWAIPEEHDTPRTLPDMLKALFDARLQTPEDILVQTQWILGGVLEAGADFYKFIKSRDLAKNEGLILRHLLRLVILAEEFDLRSDHDPDYARLSEAATQICRQVDPRYTDRFLESQAQERSLTPP